MLDCAMFLVAAHAYSAGARGWFNLFFGFQNGHGDARNAGQLTGSVPEGGYVKWEPPDKFVWALGESKHS
jgi:hypothetical protein